IQISELTLPLDIAKLSVMVETLQDFEDKLVDDSFLNTLHHQKVSSLQMKIVAEDNAVEARSAEFLGDWEKEKPVEGSLRPEDALMRIQVFENRYVKLRDDRGKVAKAKEALEPQEPGTASVGSETKLQVSFRELQDLKAVWQKLQNIWKQIDELREKPWLSVDPRKLGQQLDGLLESLKKDLPARMRHYASYNYVLRTIQGYCKINKVIVELKSEALKERHWKRLMRSLGVARVLSDLSLGMVWDVDLQKNETLVTDVILVAQEEMALEKFLKQVRESWQLYELDMVNYQNKWKLIRGWDDLFNKVKEDINSVSAMKLSPYYKVFEEEVATWEEKLNRIHSLFDVWIDVQRRWVYLEGIFSGSSDIQALLPVETSRFQSISAEFLTLMRKVVKSPKILDVLNIAGVQRSLERLSDLLGKIQKALGEYLERERSCFPRFYFVGDEDLLEIIGNSKNIGRLQKHFKKMFAGVAAILLNEENTKVIGIASREGEEVLFPRPVDLEKHPKINEWLEQVEKEMRLTLAQRLADAVGTLKKLKDGYSYKPELFIDWVDQYQAQIVVLAVQTSWCEEVEAALAQAEKTASPQPLEAVLSQVERTLTILADSVLGEQPPVRRKKLEHLINEFVHKRTVTRNLLQTNSLNPKAFAWLCEMRFYFDSQIADPLQQLTIRMANAKFFYGFEYLGVQDKLVQTPLTGRCYLTMTQAMDLKLGGSLFGPAGTGKTESVKALGHQLGRFVLVFNCNETFDFQAMGRIFVGLCQIQAIQETLKSQKEGESNRASNLSVELLGKEVKVNTDMAIFITMNPDYAGRSNLPDNLKKLFRSLAMTEPDRQLIAEVMLFSQGFRTAEKLASKIVLFFKLCSEQLSNQSHYDFGLRALKAVLVSAENIKRDRVLKIKEDLLQRGDQGMREGQIAEGLPEQEILIQAICETMVPKLVAGDIPLLFSLLSDVFPGVEYSRGQMDQLKQKISEVCEEMFLVCGEGEEVGGQWMEKVLQLYQISNLNHGLMMVGPSGSGKTAAWKVLLRALERLEGVEGVAHVLDPKAISKEALYGTLDPNTREWTDGLFTHILRKIIDNVRGEISKRQWIIFDGDVDPEWVENLNSVLDDNKLLTLPNGERLSIPPNVRIMFEVQDLKYATLTTVSRCGMVWFSEDVLSSDMLCEHFLKRLRALPLAAEGEEEAVGVALRPSTTEVRRGRTGGGTSGGGSAEDNAHEASPALRVQREVATLLQPLLAPGGLAQKCYTFAANHLEHIMDFTRLRALQSLFSMLTQAVRTVLEYNQAHPDFPMPPDQLEKFVPKSLVQSILWSFAGDCKLKGRAELGDFISSATTIPLHPTAGGTMPIIDYEVTAHGEWSPWSDKVPTIEVETHKVASPDVVVPTVDTIRHEVLLKTWLAEHKPIVLCGPPGSGKTMTLFSTLRSLPDMEVVGLNFSSATSPELLLKTFDHYCEYKRTPTGTVLAPVQLGKWLILFCDEINLPDMDKYGTQRVISFLRQMLEHGGFYRTSDHTWVRLERIQFVGACNPPTDPGRKPLSHRFLRHVPLVYVDYPGQVSLKQIYGTFNRAMLRLIPSLKPYADPLTAAMVEFFLQSQERFTQDVQPHYVYSPREMTRWVRGICEAIRPLESLSVEGLVRIWAHEALRLFQDRLVEAEERKWTDEAVDRVALRRTPTGTVLAPVQLGKWLILFCDEINLPDMDKYGTQRVISFLRQMLEHGGFYRTSDHTWVRLERIQFVGACNPPTDPGRKPLSHRFLRHVPLVYVDYPGQVSLKQIYGTFNRAMLRLIPDLKPYADPLTAAMVEFFLQSQERFTQDVQPHYVYSPREMTRWVRGICEAIRPLESLSVEGLVRIWAHEALRLFQDRLVEAEERKWTDEAVDRVALRFFPSINAKEALSRPILYSNLMSKDYAPVDRAELREFVKARLKVFYEEELDVPLVLFNEVLDHVLRIDRIFRQPQGHLLLIGVSGAGKTTLSRFVAWMNGLSVFQVKVHNQYTADDFDEDLRSVLRRSGCRGEKICFIMDESNILESGFLERMNTLLANGEVPGLFEGDEYTTLMTQCKEGAQREGLMLDSTEELYRWFTQQVMRNLHVVFTMNPSADGLKDRAATSPALFNRCVLNWFGDWSDQALFHVAREFIYRIELDRPEWRAPDFFPAVTDDVPNPPTHRDAVLNAFVFVHQTLHKANQRLAKRGANTMAVTPRHYLDFIKHFVKLHQEKRAELEDQQLHLKVGLDKIAETVKQVEDLQKSLKAFREELRAKTEAAETKLKQMMEDQKEAEKKKTQSQQCQNAA
ncbi:unnamed protein product, partial [Cyprideis torosa]